ncbi:MAG: peptidase [Herpetosiphonaceae bacterium]|nr:MAG: peptidase [Herpetosiphonaceae bacterium]
MRIIDAHLDIAWNAIALGRDPTLPIAESRRREEGSPLAEREGEVTVSLAELRSAGAAIVFATLFVLPEGVESTLEAIAYSTPEQAHEQALAHLEYYRNLEQRGIVQIVTSRQSLHDVTEHGALGLVLLMEGADPIRTPEELSFWYEAGVRIVGPAWQATRYCGGTNAPGPLTALGRELLAEMDRRSLALDLSHMAEESFWQALELFQGPVIASHSNCRTFIPTDRHLSDAMIRAIVERDGVIGVLPYNGFLVAEWDGCKDSVGLEDVLRHIEHICSVAGDRLHVGIGSDFDGGFGRQGIPREFDSWADLALLAQGLSSAGWSEQEVAGFMGGNWLRWLERVLP